MRGVVMVGALVLAGCAGGPAAVQMSDGLDGQWTVDLSATPAEPYTKTMALQLNADGTVRARSTIARSWLAAGRLTAGAPV